MRGGCFEYRGEDRRGVEDCGSGQSKRTGVTVNAGLDATSQLRPCLEILKSCKGFGTAKLVSAGLVPEDAPRVEGVEVRFIMPPLVEADMTEHFHFVFWVWL